MFSFGQFAATTQFYLHGRYNCTATGWETHAKAYPQPDLLTTEMDLSGKVYMITGANAGIGREITKFLASRGGTVFMVCRNSQRANAAKLQIIEEISSVSSSQSAASLQEKLNIILCDCSLQSEIVRAWQEFVMYFEKKAAAADAEANNSNVSSASASTSSSSRPSLRLDGLICNAGAMFDKYVPTAEGIEQTCALHLLFGTYALVRYALPTLNRTGNARVVVVSSAGMYNVNFPNWYLDYCSQGLTAAGLPPAVATSASTSGSAAAPPAAAAGPPRVYDGQLQYAYAKRGQVLLCEHWTTIHRHVKFVSCHPGWTLTEAVDAAYGESKRYLEPLRTPWQGAEGIIYLCVCDASLLEGGAFYLDRSVMKKHMAGPFFSEGSYTKNTPEEVDDMVEQLEALTVSVENANASAIAAAYQLQQLHLQQQQQQQQAAAASSPAEAGEGSGDPCSPATAELIKEYIVVDNPLTQQIADTLANDGILTTDEHPSSNSSGASNSNGGDSDDSKPNET